LWLLVGVGVALGSVEVVVREGIVLEAHLQFLLPVVMEAVITRLPLVVVVRAVLLVALIMV
jgi:hypothetical protein